jgi:RHS repeat-associated protein
LFPGQYLDDETGLAYNLHRYYDPDTARYVSQDPLGAAPAPNPATYVHNPHTWADPLGLNPRGPQPPDPSGSTSPASPAGATHAGPSTAGTGRLPNRLTAVDGKHVGVNGLNDPAPGDHTVFRRSDSSSTDVGVGRVEHYRLFVIERGGLMGTRSSASA